MGQSTCLDMCCSGFNPSSKESAAQTDLVTQRREPFNWLLFGMGPQADFDFWFESKTDSTDWKLNCFFFNDLFPLVFSGFVSFQKNSFCLLAFFDAENVTEALGYARQILYP